MVQLVLDHPDSDPSQLLIVGDNTEHIKLGKKAGIKTCAVKNGDNNCDAEKLTTLSMTSEPCSTLYNRSIS